MGSASFQNYDDRTIEPIDVDKLIRIQFYMINQTVTNVSDDTGVDNFISSQKLTYVPGVLCSEKYKDRIDASSTTYSEKIAYELNGPTSWVCPDIEEFTLLGNPWLVSSVDG